MTYLLIVLEIVSFLKAMIIPIVISEMINSRQKAAQIADELEIEESSEMYESQHQYSDIDKDEIDRINREVQKHTPTNS